jgi:hypothetical protein
MVLDGDPQAVHGIERPAMQQQQQVRPDRQKEE